MPPSFHIQAPKTHLKWSRSLPPILTVPSGTTLTLSLPDGGNNQITPSNAPTALRTFSLDEADPAVGPVFIEGAQPGDVLRVEFLSLRPASYGWTAIFPNFGLLADEFPEGYLHMWDLEKASRTGKVEFKKGIELPLNPFLGIVGVAPEEEGEFSTIPPYKTGGNMDCKYLVAGSTLYLPVKVPGALFSCGDGHASQGDGEVCGTAIETPMEATLRLTVEKDMPWVTSPHYVAPPRRSEESVMGEYAAMGIHSDLREATRDAVRGLMAWLQGEKGLSREESYVLASVAGNLKMVEVVDMPNYAIACAIPLSLFRY